MQKLSDYSAVTGDENCLFLNVFVPDQISSDEQKGNDGESKLPVMVYIHGGAYQTGCSSSYGPDFLLEQNVIVVSIEL